jgi:hypothetical protein
MNQSAREFWSSLKSLNKTSKKYVNKTKKQAGKRNINETLKNNLTIFFSFFLTIVNDEF